MKYIGATDFFVRAPFVIEGIIIGLIGAVFFNKGLALFIPDGVISDFTRYFMTLFWILGLYPYLFTKLKK